ncbi:MAG: agarase, partial [Spirochaetia bacterium]|nr:agarase [Spirochaetia bacterium]
TGLVPVKDQAERARAYELYMKDALNSTNIVGAHWFQYVDQPLTGRWLDGENYQVGFVDVCDNPYPETIEASRKIGAALYETEKSRRK